MTLLPSLGICPRTYLLCAIFSFSLILSYSAHQGSSGPKSYSIYWNISTAAFRIDNTDHIFDINKGNSKFEYDQMNIICPVYNSREVKDDETEKYMIYNVSREEYETCRITNPNPKVIAVCDKPFKKMYFTITFRPFSPQPGGLEFLPGHDYYFISTSSKDDLHRRIGGRCLTHNMKVLFKVWYPVDADLSTTTIPPPVVITDPYPSWHFVTPKDLPYPSLEDKGITSTVRSVINKTTKKTKAYDKHPNDVEKSSLTRGTSFAHRNSPPFITIMLAIILFNQIR